ncbi:MAG: Glucose-1-phosphate thymidylyltransferase [Chlamydiae bacterium]|nr:Glucose-1-phosphate thymidylyltransferase [Chlamydiota bacterium]
MIKGIVLAGGSGTRLYPLTASMSKQLLPVYDKPMIYYPLSTLMLAGVRDILIISTPLDIARFESLLGDGSQWGLHLHYAVQSHPGGLAQAFIIAKEFIRNDNCVMILGDNIFYGNELSSQLRKAVMRRKGATIFSYKVNHPKNYGVIEYDENGKVIGIEEKPQHPKSRYAVTGLYFYDSRVSEIAQSLKPSERGELEITDINKRYMEIGELNVVSLSRGVAWLDMGAFETLLNAAQFIQTIQERQGVKIACLEEIAYRMGYINAIQLQRTADSIKDSEYSQYLLDVLEENKAQIGVEA